AGGDPRPLTAEGGETTTAADPFLFVSGFAVSPDGKQVAARRPDGTYWLYPVDGGSPRPLPGIDPSSNVVSFDERAEALYLARGLTSLRVDRYDLASGRLQPWKELSPSDPAGIAEVSHLALNPDGKSYVYFVERILSDLFVVEGLE